MSASLHEPDFPTISSSGHTDGLGRRLLAFDRESGVLTEHLHLRPELVAFESGIQSRLEALSALTDARFATPGSVVRLGGELTVVSEFVSGSRLSDLLDLAQDNGLVPGVDAALGYLLDALEGLAALHATCGVPHGLIAPARTMVTVEGRVVFLDPLYAAVVERLGLSAVRLWKDFRVAVIGRPRGVRLDPAADVAQAALGAVMLVLGRNLDESEFPTALPSLIADVADVAQIRGPAAFAAGLQAFLERALPHPGTPHYTDAAAALADVRAFVDPDMDADGCRRALADFVSQTSDGGVAADPVFEDDDLADEDLAPDAAADADLDPELASEAGTWSRPVATFEPTENPLATDEGQDEADEEAEALRALLASGALAEPDFEPAGDALIDAEQTADDEELEFEIQLKTTARRGRNTAPAVDADDADEADEADDDEDEPPPNIFELSGNEVDSSIMDRFGFGFRMPPKPEPPPIFMPAPSEDPTPAAAADETSAVVDDAGAPNDAAGTSAAAESDAPTESSHRSRRKKAEKKSARARKDKLRSTVASPEPLKVLTDDEPTPPTPAPPGQAMPGAPAPAAAAVASASGPVTVSENAPPSAPAGPGWLVPPEKAAHFASMTSPAAVSSPAFGSPPPPVRSTPAVPPPPAVVSYTPPASAPPQPVFPGVAAAPPRLAPPAPPARPAPPAQPATSETPAALAGGPVSKIATLKMKSEPPAGFAPKRTRPRPQAAGPLPPVVPLGYGPPPEAQTESRGFPKKLAVALLVIVAAAVGAGRYYIAEGQRTAGDVVTDTPVATPDARARQAAAVLAGGTVKAQSQPSGARVLLDRREVGRTPLTIERVAPGRHVLTFESSSSSVTREFQVAAGQSIDLDVPLYSGWVAIYAPIVLNVAEGGKALGTTEEGRLMLSPGRHRLSLTNTSLGYRTIQNVEITAGETTTLRVEPTGEANLNAVPWAEVWVDGKKLGDTPMAAVALPLGSREIVFRNAQFGERKVTALIRGNQSTPVSVDFTK